MYRNYLKVAVRNLTKNRTFSFIHILGLTIGTAACLLIFQYVSFEKSYDQFHEHAENVYRVPIRYSEGFSSITKTATNHPGLGPAMKADFPEVVSFVRILNPKNIGSRIALSTINAAGHRTTFVEDNIFLADSTFFEVFSFPVKSGDISNLLNKPNSIVLTEKLADKYFGEMDPVGRTLQFYGNTLTVTGVIENVPANSHLSFDGLLSFTTFFSGISESNAWIWPEFYTYVLLNPGTNPDQIEDKFHVFTERYMAAIHKEHNFKTYFSLQPLLDIHLNTDCANEPTPPGSKRMTYFLSLLGIFILVIAWVNYVNLSTAKSLDRAKEVATRKVAGADRAQLTWQFLMESVLLNGISIILGLVLAKILLAWFSNLVGKEIGDSLISLNLLTNPWFWLVLIGSILFSGIIAGIYPALVLSGFKPARILKGSFHNSSGGVLTRKFLVGFQLVLSLSLIALTILVARQLSFMYEEELGYNKSQIMVIKSPMVSDSLSYARSLSVVDELASFSEVNSVAKSTEIPGKLISSRVDSRNAGQGKEYNQAVFIQSIDHQFLQTYEINLVAGRNFSPTDSTNIFRSDYNKVLINELLSESYGFETAEDAIGERITFKFGPGEHQAEIIGVVNNYHQRSLKESYDPILFYYPTFGNWGYYSLNLTSGDWATSVQSLEASFLNYFPDSAFEYFFLNEYFDRQYKDEQRFSKVCWVMAGLAILITCLGIFGLSALMLSKRTKEIGIRKVLGASIAGILGLISKDFIRMLILSNLIAIPIVFYFASEWLNGFAYRIAIGWHIFVLPLSLLLIIILGIIGVQIYRSSILNPVESLRSE